MAVGADEFQAVVLSDFLHVLLDRPAEGIIGDQQVPALRLRIRLHEVVDHRLRRGIGARRPLEGIAMAARAGDVLGAAAEVVQHFLALRHFRYRERDAGGPRADHKARAFAVDRFFGAPGRGPGLRRAVARDVLDRLAEDLHAALFERHAHAAVVERPDIGKGSGLVPEAKDHDLARLRAHDRRKAERRGRGANLQDLSAFHWSPPS